ncbi:NADH-ubiquinone oxidoreductase 9.5 kDa subunit [Eremomyces bilateralis CBS 781.70]|uniref:NADH-ubiquinone oxidoreductase 9.5 kDa subunit n=1 Tax=Eremomyces bilateralis CBS 781.70 TaxID=1392243 RepID=A0A6G1FYW0_9PEZI|nr:NADH-ubiquinone oxidoreductase 9.5 kDa subunit [Eremomyces bilateralis CBS 781.70]KAF1810880.1 NADH-ubiquinone oxidoreductase 9.5 kDa subunit [Eremomyces bilateralis CBS 781.70]
MSRPFFWHNPLKLMRWASREKPAYFWAIAIGSVGPALMVVVPPIRARMGDVEIEQIPHSYPVPTGPRRIPKGYDDP